MECMDFKLQTSDAAVRNNLIRGAAIFAAGCGGHKPGRVFKKKFSRECLANSVNGGKNGGQSRAATLFARIAGI